MPKLLGCSNATCSAEKCIAINIYTKKQEMSQISNLTFQLKTLGKKEQIKHSKDKEGKKNDMNKLENRKTVEKTNGTKSQVFKK